MNCFLFDSPPDGATVPVVNEIVTYNGHTRMVRAMCTVTIDPPPAPALDLPRRYHAIRVMDLHSADWRGRADACGRGVMPEAEVAPVPASSEACGDTRSEGSEGSEGGEGGEGESGGSPDDGGGDDDPEPPMPGATPPGDQPSQGPGGKFTFLLLAALLLLFLPPYLYGLTRFADSLPHVSAGAAVAFASLALPHFALLRWICRAMIAMTAKLEGHGPSDDNAHVSG